MLGIFAILRFLFVKYFKQRRPSPKIYTDLHQFKNRGMISEKNRNVPLLQNKKRLLSREIGWDVKEKDWKKLMACKIEMKRLGRDKRRDNKKLPKGNRFRLNEKENCTNHKTD